ncbi:hypothetical protein J7T55_008795 [Diaporthe amygdali]|uniref:uncharacterized protein n=1 Tax=Phomopsis amygdali TaxID=1214568 RepID=UPI0022FE9F35|nr:uncharacterized protein J7T55_008795 [Diaporthe amygdali]KAJ0121629.1 hypothetical protein J7T55_008795 [Diaporthe amygdali]
MEICNRKRGDEGMGPKIETSLGMGETQAKQAVKVKPIYLQALSCNTAKECGVGGMRILPVNVKKDGQRKQYHLRLSVMGR